jgi:hypothetical protein
MGNHRRKISAPDSDLHFRVAMDVLETVEYLEARGEQVTPDTLYQRLQSPPSGDPTITISRIEQGLTQVRFWREQFVTRDIVHHRHYLAALANAYSTGKWTGIPRETGHPFQAKLDRDSTGNWTPEVAKRRAG